MVRSFWGLVVLWIIGAGFMVVHALLFDKVSHQTQLSSLVSITGFSSPSLSTDFYEPRLLGDKVEHPSYPHMLPINRMDFIYAR